MKHEKPSDKLFIQIASHAGGNTSKIPINVSRFPSGEVNVVLPVEELEKQMACMSNDEPVTAVVHSVMLNSDDVMLTLLAASAVWNFFKKSNLPPLLDTQLTAPYLPYSRQDRICHEGEAFSLAVMVNLFGMAGYDSVITDDLHSNVIDNIYTEYVISVAPYGFYQKVAKAVLKKEGVATNICWCLPDKGAVAKFTSFEESNPNTKLQKIIASKTRTADGLTSTLIKKPGYLHNDIPIIVVDDICDGGATFIELAKVLNDEFPHNRLYLSVTHGFFTKGLDELREYYSGIYSKFNYTTYTE